MKPALPTMALLACVLVSGCDDFDSLYGGYAREPQFSDPTDDDEPGEGASLPTDPPTTDPDPVDVPTDPVVSQ
jgi:hypothetical protein